MCKYMESREIADQGLKVEMVPTTMQCNAMQCNDDCSNAMQCIAMMTAEVCQMLPIGLWNVKGDMRWVGVMPSGLLYKMMLMTVTVRTMMRTRTRIGGLKLLNLLQPLSHLNRYRHCHFQCHRQRWPIGIIIDVLRRG